MAGTVKPCFDEIGFSHQILRSPAFAGFAFENVGKGYPEVARDINLLAFFLLTLFL